jgi:hypothetical protein
MRHAALVSLALVLAACGQSVTGTKAYVTVGNVWSDAHALPLAQEHCEKYGKTARFKYIENHRATFDCVDA